MRRDPSVRSGRDPRRVRGHRPQIGGHGAFFLIREAVFVCDGLSVDVQCPEDCWEEFEGTVTLMQGVSIDWEAMTEEWEDPEEVDL